MYCRSYLESAANKHCIVCHRAIGTHVDYEVIKTKPVSSKTKKFKAKTLYIHRTCYNAEYHQNIPLTASASIAKMPEICK